MSKASAFAAILLAHALPGALAQDAARDEKLAIGDQVSGQLFGQLMTLLQTKIASDGAEAAIAYCRLEALPITKEVGRTFPQVKSLRRTALRTRNSANKPDATDRSVLEQWKAAWIPGSPPKSVLREVELTDGGKEIRYYRPILTIATCLACHGSADTLLDDVKAALRKDYPEDEATGFAEGDLRGAIVVTFSGDQTSKAD